MTVVGHWVTLYYPTTCYTCFQITHTKNTEKNLILKSVGVNQRWFGNAYKKCTLYTFLLGGPNTSLTL